MGTDLLIKPRCNIDLQTVDGATPLHIATDQGHAAVTQLLLAARCNIDLKAMDGLTALLSAWGTPGSPR